MAFGTDNSTKFKNKNGMYLLLPLFYETASADKSSVLYTLKSQDHEGFSSIHRLYLETSDPTEYRFALKYFDSWAHWQLLAKATWFLEYLSAWREELDVKLRSETLARIVSTALSDSPSAFPANRYLLEALKEPAGASKRGRPTKVAIQQEINRQASLAVLEASDLQRISKVN